MLRRQMRIRRKSIGEMIKEHHGKIVATQLIQLPCFQKANHIAIYSPFDGEMPTRATAENIWRAKKQCYLPIVTPILSQLSFAPYHQDSRWIGNTFGIREPEYQLHELFPANQLDLVIAPLVAFDKEGNRLGMGGGYYDKTFAFLKQSPVKKPVMIGFAYSFQEHIQLYSQPWDIPLVAVITEEKVHYCHLLRGI